MSRAPGGSYALDALDPGALPLLSRPPVSRTAHNKVGEREKVPLSGSQLCALCTRSRGPAPPLTSSRVPHSPQSGGRKRKCPVHREAAMRFMRSIQGPRPSSHVLRCSAQPTIRWAKEKKSCAAGGSYVLYVLDPGARPSSHVLRCPAQPTIRWAKEKMSHTAGDRYALYELDPGASPSCHVLWCPAQPTIRWAKEKMFK
ncbi:hypothetical protein NDU88_001494 [Pleurodeles waltl]|uniref:Uncharacterized protein n=1 Tax=Pleurodeles waltl TaxID=8319 RepID=A0AAV7V8M1_PLEWA|nr:hypothetical protein NDU88_001494 [Pleurodeles waltl]